MTYLRGSEWRKWDLHIHSNASDGNSTPKEIIDKAKQKNLSVIALTDHHTAKNIDEAKQLGKKDGIHVISGIEFRTEYGEKSVHIIGLFPDKWKETVLNSQALHDLILSPLGLSETLIKSKGKEKKPGLDDDKVFKEGMFLVQVSFKEAAKKIHEYGGVVVVHAGSKSNSLDEQMKHEGKGVSNVKSIWDSLGVVKEELFTQGYIDICEIRHANDSANFYWEKFRKPSITASDAHSVDEIGRESIWIKADPTFLGLRQIMNEPLRAFIGERPEIIGRVALNSTKYISELLIDTVEGRDDPTNVWFKSINIPMNHELVAIIGNKGNGKSAISDIIGLCSDSDHSESFLFLHEDKFKKRNLADRFSCKIKFASGAETASRLLSHNIDRAEVAKVQYLPQHYFEKVCNEIGKVESFRKEIEKVVFQYISEEKKLRKASFQELITFKKESIEKEIRELKSSIDALNDEIILLEDKKNPEHVKTLLSKIRQKNEELRAHEQQVPPAISNPESTAESGEAVAQKQLLNQWSTTLATTKLAIAALEDEIESDVLAIEELGLFKRDVESKKKEILLFIEENRGLADRYSLVIDNILKVKIDLLPIDTLIVEKQAANLKRKADLGLDELPVGVAFDELKLKSKVLYCKDQIEKVKAKLSEPEREYQRYLDNYKRWEEKKAAICGAKDTPDSLEYYKEELKYLESSLDVALKEKRNARLAHTIDIYKKKKEVKDFYDNIKAEIDEKLKECGEQNLTIESSFSFQPEFADLALGYINKSKVGSFRGQEEGKKVLQEQLLAPLVLNDESSIRLFLENFISYLEIDKRDAGGAQITFVGDQVARRSDFYSFLFGLDYLYPHYELKQNGKKLDELSPGEKGALLLVFYLVLDR